MTAAVIHEPTGIFGVHRSYSRSAIFALLFAIMSHLCIIGGYYLVRYFQEEDEPVMTVRIIKYSDLGPPPSVTNTEVAPQVAVSVPVAKPKIGVPVPIPDAEVSPEQTIATQQELSAVQSPAVGEGSGAGAPVIEQDLKIEEEPEDFVAVEKMPVAIKEVKPEYPDFARRIGAEGTVWVKIWVDKEGHPKKVVIVKSDNEVFNEAATKAAMQYLFTPAVMNNGPVSVWVSIPFRFKLSK